MKNNIFNEFTNVYPISKTLRFELKPIGDTLRHIKEKGLINEDKERAKKYKKVKVIIDDFHRDFIEKALSKVKLATADLYSFEDVYLRLKHKNNEEDLDALKKSLVDAQKNLTSEILQQVEKVELWNNLFNAKLIKQELPAWLEQHGYSDDDKALVKDFYKWTTYFKGFHENRKNVYLEDKHTSIIYRIIYDNLPKFIDNVEKYRNLKNEYPNFTFGTIEKDLQDEFQGKSLDEVFSIDFFNEVLGQQGIDRVNYIIGGKFVKDETEKRKGVNEYINLFSQQFASKEAKSKDEKKNELKKTKKKIKSYKMTRLFKQILSDRDEHSFTLDKFEDDKDTAEAIKGFLDNNYILPFDEHSENRDTVLVRFKKLLLEIKEADIEHIYVKNDKAITDISNVIYHDWSIIPNALREWSISKFPQKGNNLTDTIIKTREKWLKNTQYFSISELESALHDYVNSLGEDNEIKNATQMSQAQHPICEYFINLEIKEDDSTKNIFDIDSSIDSLLSVLEKDHEKNSKEIISNEDEIEIIKNALDNIMDILHFIKPIFIELKKKDKDDVDAFEKAGDFYAEFDSLYASLSQIISLYNMVRNYVTQKPFRTEKFKLNFNHQTLLKGFVDSRTTYDNATQYGAYLFRKKIKINGFNNAYNYYLGISKDSKFFRNHLKNKVENSDKSDYEKLEYYQPKSTTFYSNDYSSKYKNEIVTKLQDLLREKLIVLNKEEEKEIIDKLTEKLLKNDMAPRELINKIKESDNQYQDIRPHDTLTEVFEDISFKNIVFSCLTDAKKHLEKYKEKNSRLVSIIDKELSGADGLVFLIDELDEIAKIKQYNYFHISQKELNDAMGRKEKKLYIFQISNKDLSFYDSYVEGKRKKIGKKNLHTLYFEALMSGCQNIIDIGKGEVFYRESSIKDKIITHNKNEWISKKNDSKTGKTISEDKQKEYLNSNDRQHLSIFDYDITKNNRYTKDKFLFHVSIALNYSASHKNISNDAVNKVLKEHRNDIHILSIDRGERHLAYYTLLDTQGNIVEHHTFNIIKTHYNNVDYVVDYHDKLDSIAKKRDDARKNWKEISNIKEMKEGYLSLVVHKIVTLVEKYNAIIVFEDLNFGFKKGRFKIEKQVYQKLEKMLIDKLNYLVFKDREYNEAGGVLNAYQLTSKFKSFKEMRKQTGIIFYVPAGYTSKICPETGFVNQLYPKYESVNKAKDYLGCFESISFNKDKNYFEFSFDYQSFKNTTIKGEWTICSYGKRLENFRNPEKKSKWLTREIDITEELISKFDEYNISYQNEENIKDQILSQADAKFFKSIMYYLKMILQMRNSISNTAEDYIISPVCNDKGEFFDSRSCDDSLPQNADANGAYHIGLKGLLLLDRLKEWEEGKKLDITIRNEEWFEFAEEHAKNKHQ